jgi:predicted  nucleic acid-binding Zn-ribbon protein
MRATLVVGVFALSAIACGGLSYTVDRDLLKDVSIENKLVLFDAENDVSIALDERESLKKQVSEARQDISDAKAKIKEAKADAERAAEKGDANAQQVGDLAEETYDKKIDYLNERIGFLKRRLDAQERLIYVAWARYELAKAKLVKKNNVRGANDVEIPDFEEQVDKFVELAKEDTEGLKQEEAQLAAVQQEWLAQREKLQAASGGGLGSSWVEDGSIWGY